MEGIRPFLTSWWMLEAPASCGHGAGKLGRGRVQGKKVITSSTSAIQHLKDWAFYVKFKNGLNHLYRHSWGRQQPAKPRLLPLYSSPEPSDWPYGSYFFSPFLPLFMLFPTFLKDLRSHRSVQNECNCSPAVRCCVSSTTNLCTVPQDKQHQMSSENHILLSFSPLAFEALALCESDSLSHWMQSESPFSALSQHPCTTSYSFPMIICISFGRP